MDKRSSMGVIDDLGHYIQYSAAEAMTWAVSNPGLVPRPSRPPVWVRAWAWRWRGRWPIPAPGAPLPHRPPRPPYRPRRHRWNTFWHIADNGQTKGPFSKASLGRMVSDGTLTRET